MEITHYKLPDIQCDKCGQWLREVITNPMPVHPTQLGEAMARAGWLNNEGTIYCYGCKNVYIK